MDRKRLLKVLYPGVGYSVLFTILYLLISFGISWGAYGVSIADIGSELIILSGDEHIDLITETDFDSNSGYFRYFCRVSFIYLLGLFLFSSSGIGILLGGLLQGLPELVRYCIVSPLPFIAIAYWIVYLYVIMREK